MLSGGQQRNLTICVEDAFAKIVLRELIRSEDAELLKAVNIEAVGSNDAVREAVKLMGKLSRKAIGVRDGDTGAAPDAHLYSLPGVRPPEEEVFTHNAVRSRLTQEFSISNDKMNAALNGIGHHQYSEKLAELVEVDRSHLEGVAIGEYAKHVDATQRKSLIAQITAHA